MARRSSRQKSNGSIPFAVFAILMVSVVGVFLHNRMGGGSAQYVLGATSVDAPLFSSAWFNNILSMFGLGGGKATTSEDRTYTLPSYDDGSGSSGGFFGYTSGESSSVVSSDDPDVLMSELGTTSDDGGKSDFDDLESEASGL